MADCGEVEMAFKRVKPPHMNCDVLWAILHHAN